MPTYKLYYFNAKGNAEITRLVFAAAGVEYEDIRFKDRDDWLNNYKHLSPTGQCPFLDVDGKKIGQSLAIARLVAREHGLYGESNMDGAMIDQVLYTLDDLTKPLIDWHFEKDEAKKAEKEKKLAEETLPESMQRLDKLLKGNGSKGYFAGNKLSIADLAVFNQCSGLVVKFPKCMDKCKELPAFIDRIKALPKIADWLAKRPQTDF
ncbi:glutathione S-transferase 1 isoform X2 [Lingula anatina]|uniref:glutathione transferase n=1 Tax=Lingula anatina TaxID=7574 RepID=A0A1S3HLH8_LINAN|nr:glutathione S-transferase 1 isoform X1 [Lingula anatina]XP_013385869.1 glutathione S-transferase 1 isoform X2 [Lingula anatina]|eukprot:XP_013385868.1 glutathione S-transferase 1 isoform X1 [Lingula anatina]